MDGQPPPSQRVRLSFAVKPDPVAARRLHDWAGWHRDHRGLRGPLLSSDRLHITLMLMWDGRGSPPARVMNVARAMGDAVKCAPFDIALDHAASFARADGRRPYVLLGEDGVVDLRLLHRDLAGASLKFTDTRRAFSRFTPHMTLLYDDQHLDRQAIDPITWTASEFLLIESWVGLTRHVVRGRWPLVDRGKTDTPAQSARSV